MIAISLCNYLVWAGNILYLRNLPESKGSIENYLYHDLFLQFSIHSEHALDFRLVNTQTKRNRGLPVWKSTTQAFVSVVHCTFCLKFQINFCTVALWDSSGWNTRLPPSKAVETYWKWKVFYSLCLLLIWVTCYNY